MIIYYYIAPICVHVSTIKKCAFIRVKTTGFWYKRRRIRRRKTRFPSELKKVIKKSVSFVNPNHISPALCTPNNRTGTVAFKFPGGIAVENARFQSNSRPDTVGNHPVGDLFVYKVRLLFYAVSATKAI